MAVSFTLRDGARGFLFSSGAPVAGVVAEALGRALCSGCSVYVMEGPAPALREALLRWLLARSEWDLVHGARRRSQPASRRRTSPTWRRARRSV